MPKSTTVPTLRATRRVAAVLLVVAAGVAGAAEIYKRVDEQGNVIYSDRPHPDAEPVDAPPVQVVDLPEVRPPPQRPAPAKALDYRRIAVAAPEDDATVREITGNVAVSAILEPPVQTPFGHRVQLYVDGSPYGEPGTRTQWLLANADRGTHTLRIAVLDRDGRQVATSPTTRFHLHRNFIRNN